jgi:hypothetical protein
MNDVCISYFHGTLAYVIYIYGIYFYGFYFYGDILLQSEKKLNY